MPTQVNPTLPKYWWAHVLIGIAVLAVGALFFFHWATHDSLKGLDTDACNAKGGIMKPTLIVGWSKNHYDWDRMQCVDPSDPTPTDVADH